MTVTIVFLCAIVGLAGWWLLQQRLAAKPWLEQGVIGETDGTGALSLPAPKLGLWVFLAVASCLFALLISAYIMRMGYQDWRPLPAPRVLWLNTVVLILSSIALQGANIAVGAKRMDAVRARLFAGGVTALLFLAGQIWAWRQLTASGFLLATNPADSFFYLITAAHGLHVLGGLVALSWAADRAWRSFTVERVRLSVAMCATYWHFLLFVWLILFGLLLGGAESLGAICRQLLS